MFHLAWLSAVGRHKGVQLGFTKGYLMQDENNYLEKGSRKEVYIKTYHSLKELNEDIIKDFLFQAVELDAMK
jgi:hypothetical protein